MIISSRIVALRDKARVEYFEYLIPDLGLDGDSRRLPSSATG